MTSSNVDICSVLRSEILDGRYDGAARFPSEPALARRFGVSRSTITRVLVILKQDGLIVSRKGSGSRVRFEKLGGSRCIGILVPGPETSSFYAGIVKGAVEKCRELGYKPLIRRVTAADGKVEQRRDASAVASEFTRNHVDGVLLFPFSPSHNDLDPNEIILEALQKDGIVIQLVNRSVNCSKGQSYDLVCIDNVAAGRRIAAHLISQGVRRCVFLNSPEVESINMRYIGLAAGFAEVRKGEVHQIKGPSVSIKAVRGWIRRFKPQAVVCGNDHLAYQLLDVLSRIGVDVPDDVMVAGFDDVPCETNPDYGLTTIAQPLVDIGMAAIARLVERIRNRSMPRCTIVLDAPLIVRASTTRGMKLHSQKEERNS